MSESSLLDIAPSVLGYFDVPIPAHMEGRPLPCLGVSGRVRSDAPVAAYTGMHGPNADYEYSGEEQAIIEKRLADLGYLE
jgi:arylsulfatase A-like enzyme